MAVRLMSESDPIIAVIEVPHDTEDGKIEKTLAKEIKDFQKRFRHRNFRHLECKTKIIYENGDTKSVLVSVMAIEEK